MNKDKKRWAPRAATGDLLYCHAVGNKYGWFLNQLAVVLDVNVTKESYRIYLHANGRYLDIQNNDFTTGNVEVISGANCDTIKQRMYKTDIMKQQFVNGWYDKGDKGGMPDD